MRDSGRGRVILRCLACHLVTRVYPWSTHQQSQGCYQDRECVRRRHTPRTHNDDGAPAALNGGGRGVRPITGERLHHVCLGRSTLGITAAVGRSDNPHDANSPHENQPQTHANHGRKHEPHATSHRVTHMWICIPRDGASQCSSSPATPSLAPVLCAVRSTD